MGGRFPEAGEFAGADEDAGEHGAVQAAGVGVAERGVVAAEERDAVGKLVLGAVGEDEGCPAFDDARADEVCEVAVPGDLAEADYDFDLRQQGDLIREVVIPTERSGVVIPTKRSASRNP